MAKRIRILTNQITFTPFGDWVLNGTPNPGFLPGYYALFGDVGQVDGTITIVGSQFMELYDDSDVLIGTFTLADLPPGFQVTSIAQFGGIPIGNAGGGLTTYPVTVSGGATINSWDTGILPLSNLDSTYVAATMSFYFLNGFWVFNADVTIPAGVLGLRAAIVSQTKQSINSLSPQIYTGQYEDDVPLMMYEGIWTADESLCPVIDALTNVQIDDPVTGEFSWTLPTGTDGVIIVLSQTDHDDVIVSVLSPTTSYTPSDIYGAVTVSIRPITGFPLCYGPESTLTLAITTPFTYTMGEDGTGKGVDVGGSAIIQLIGNPSGIYTLVPDSTHDELIERTPSVTTQDVKIPNPKVRFGFVGE